MSNTSTTTPSKTQETTEPQATSSFIIVPIPEKEGGTFGRPSLAAACRGHDGIGILLNYFVYQASAIARNQNIDLSKVEYIRLERDWNKIVAGLQPSNTSKTTLIKYRKKLEEWGFLQVRAYRQEYDVYFHKITEAVLNPPPAEKRKPRGRHVAQAKGDAQPATANSTFEETPQAADSKITDFTFNQFSKLEFDPVKTGIPAEMANFIFEQISNLTSQMLNLKSEILNLKSEISNLTFQISNLTFAQSQEPAPNADLEAKTDALRDSRDDSRILEITEREIPAIPVANASPTAAQGYRPGPSPLSSLLSVLGGEETGAQETTSTENETLPTEEETETDQVAPPTVLGNGPQQVALFPAIEVKHSYSPEQATKPEELAKEPGVPDLVPALSKEEAEKNLIRLAEIKWGPEKMVLVSEWLRLYRNKYGHAFDDTTPDNKGKTQRQHQLESAKKIFKVCKSKPPTEESYIEAFQMRNNEWWCKKKGSPSVEHMAENTPNGKMRYLELREQLDSQEPVNGRVRPIAPAGNRSQIRTYSFTPQMEDVMFGTDKNKIYTPEERAAAALALMEAETQQGQQAQMA